MKTVIVGILGLLCLMSVAQNQPIQASPPARPCRLSATDRDCDTIPDATEHALLARFSPYFLFSHDGHDENYAPADARLYVQRSELRDSGDEDGGKTTIANLILSTTPEGLIFQSSAPKWSDNIMDSTEELPSFYHINPLEHLPGNPKKDPGRHGNDWPEILQKRNVGLYGHVVPVMLTGDYGYQGYNPYLVCPNGTTPLPPPAPRLFYKIEYWQFFGYNEAEQAYIGNHEGDWTSVQLIYDPKYDVIRTVMHFAHGQMFRFDITPEANASATVMAAPDGPMQQLISCNYRKYGSNIDLAKLNIGVLPWKLEIKVDQLLHAQQNVLRLFKGNARDRRYEHPVVYIENGTHEFFPSEAWSFYGAPKHNGLAQHYLTAAPPNLGEVDWPLDESNFATVILRFNGRWGTFSRLNDPAQGPPLHDNWTPIPNTHLWDIHQAKHFGN